MFYQQDQAFSPCLLSFRQTRLSLRWLSLSRQHYHLATLKCQQNLVTQGDSAAYAGHGAAGHMRWQPATSSICRGDHGSHFTSPPDLSLFQNTPVQVSMDVKVRVLDNIFTKRLWRTVKYEEVKLKNYASPNESLPAISAYLDLYNYRRLHQILAYQTPASIYFKKGVRPLINSPFCCLDKGGHLTCPKSRAVVTSNTCINALMPSWRPSHFHSVWL
jgi:hypothetical protein